MMLSGEMYLSTLLRHFCFFDLYVFLRDMLHHFLHYINLTAMVIKIKILQTKNVSLQMYALLWAELPNIRSLKLVSSPPAVQHWNAAHMSMHQK